MNAFSSCFKPDAVQTVCRRKAEILNVVFECRERIILQINLRVGNVPDKLLKIIDMTDRHTKLPRSVVELDFAPCRVLRK
jgi:hypothetical protein